MTAMDFVCQSLKEVEIEKKGKSLENINYKFIEILSRLVQSQNQAKDSNKANILYKGIIEMFENQNKLDMSISTKGEPSFNFVSSNMKIDNNNNNNNNNNNLSFEGLNSTSDYIRFLQSSKESAKENFEQYYSSSFSVSSSNVENSFVNCDESVNLFMSISKDISCLSASASAPSASFSKTESFHSIDSSIMSSSPFECGFLFDELNSSCNEDAHNKINDDLCNRSNAHSNIHRKYDDNSSNDYDNVNDAKALNERVLAHNEVLLNAREYNNDKEESKLDGEEEEESVKELPLEDKLENRKDNERRMQTIYESSNRRVMLLPGVCTVVATPYGVSAISAPSTKILWSKNSLRRAVLAVCHAKPHGVTIEEFPLVLMKLKRFVVDAQKFGFSSLVNLLLAETPRNCTIFKDDKGVIWVFKFYGLHRVPETFPGVRLTHRLTLCDGKESNRDCGFKEICIINENANNKKCYSSVNSKFIANGKHVNENCNEQLISNDAYEKCSSMNRSILHSNNPRQGYRQANYLNPEMNQSNHLMNNNENYYFNANDFFFSNNLKDEHVSDLANKDTNGLYKYDISLSSYVNQDNEKRDFTLGMNCNKQSNNLKYNNNNNDQNARNVLLNCNDVDSNVRKNDLNFCKSKLIDQEAYRVKNNINNNNKDHPCQLKIASQEKKKAAISKCDFKHFLNIFTKCVLNSKANTMMDKDFLAFMNCDNLMKILLNKYNDYLNDIDTHNKSNNPSSYVCSNSSKDLGVDFEGIDNYTFPKNIANTTSSIFIDSINKMDLLKNDKENLKVKANEEKTQKKFCHLKQISLDGYENANEEVSKNDEINVNEQELLAFIYNNFNKTNMSDHIKNAKHYDMNLNSDLKVITTTTNNNNDFNNYNRDQHMPTTNRSNSLGNEIKEHSCNIITTNCSSYSTDVTCNSNERPLSFNAEEEKKQKVNEKENFKKLFSLLSLNNLDQNKVKQESFADPYYNNCRFVFSNNEVSNVNCLNNYNVLNSSGKNVRLIFNKDENKCLEKDLHVVNTVGVNNCDRTTGNHNLKHYNDDGFYNNSSAYLCSEENNISSNKFIEIGVNKDKNAFTNNCSNSVIYMMNNDDHKQKNSIDKSSLKDNISNFCLLPLREKDYLEANVKKSNENEILGNYKVSNVNSSNHCSEKKFFGKQKEKRDMNDDDKNKIVSKVIQERKKDIQNKEIFSNLNSLYSFCGVAQHSMASCNHESNLINNLDYNDNNNLIESNKNSYLKSYDTDINMSTMNPTSEVDVFSTNELNNNNNSDVIIYMSKPKDLTDVHEPTSSKTHIENEINEMSLDNLILSDADNYKERMNNSYSLFQELINDNESNSQETCLTNFNNDNKNASDISFAENVSSPFFSSGLSSPPSCTSNFFPSSFSSIYLDGNETHDSTVVGDNDQDYNCAFKVNYQNNTKSRVVKNDKSDLFLSNNYSNDQFSSHARILPISSLHNALYVGLSETLLDSAYF